MIVTDITIEQSAENLNNHEDNPNGLPMLFPDFNGEGEPLSFEEEINVNLFCPLND